MYKGNSILARTPKANKKYMWKGIVSHIYQKYKFGSDLQTVFFSNFKQLLDRLELCAAAYRAGNNGVRNEIVSIINAMKKGRHISIEEYMALHHSIL